MFKKFLRSKIAAILGLSAFAFITLGGTTASAQITTTATTTTPGIPSTGMAGNTTTNLVILGSSALLMVAGVMYGRQSEHRRISMNHSMR